MNRICDNVNIEQRCQLVLVSLATHHVRMQTSKIGCCLEIVARPHSQSFKCGSLVKSSYNF